MALVCNRCVLDASDPLISFDEHGICSHCRRFDCEFLPALRAAQSGERLAELDDIVEEIKRRGRKQPYDCIVGMSGGIDSTFVLLRAVDFGLRPLAVHFDSGWNSELAVSNIEGATSVLDVDLKTQVVYWPEMQDLQRSFFRASVPNCDIPQDHAFPAIALKTAAEYRIRFNLSGYNVATETMLPSAWGYGAGDLRHIKAIHRRFGDVKLDKYPTLGLFKRHIWYRYLRKVRTISPLNYMPYDKAAAKKEITERLGWRDYGGKHHESVFTRYFQGQYLPNKFGFDKRRAHFSSLIVAGQMTREEALRALDEPTYDPALQRQDGIFVPKKLGVSAPEWQQILSSEPRRHEDYPRMVSTYRAAHALRNWARSRDHR